MRMLIGFGFAIIMGLSACDRKPRPQERPVIDALRPPVQALGGCVARREWGCTTSAARDITAIMDQISD